LIRVADAIYFDANMLAYWAAGRARSEDSQDRVAYTNIERLVASDADLFFSPLTLVELNSTLYKLVRMTDGPHAGFTVGDASGAERQTMAWIAERRISVPPLGQRAFEVGMSYVTTATREHGRRLHGWDAIHMFQACRLARELERAVIIATADGDFETLIELFPEFERLVTLHDYSAV
jgi:hypothetical protein